MITNWPSSFLQWRIQPVVVRSVCFSSSSSTTTTTSEELRQELDHLHKEAQSTRTKASSARLRLMRLSEAAEKIRRQAAVSVRTGKENDARELLFQKKMVLQAMEKSKNRIELLDELAAKLNEVISVKENQLIGNVASELEVSTGTDSNPVRIVSPKEEHPKNSTENDGIILNSLQPGQDGVLQTGCEGVKRHNDEGLNDNQDSVGGNVSNKVDVLHSLKEISSYEDFLEHIDWQINKIEDELNSFLTFSALILENKNKLENSKVRQVMEILEDVHRLRARIANMMQKEVETR